MKFVSEIVKMAFNKKLIALEDLYTKNEEDICKIFSANFLSWDNFTKANKIIGTEEKPINKFYISFETKKRNTIPLINTPNGAQRIIEISNAVKNKYQKLQEYQDYKYAYVEDIDKLE